MPSKLVSKVNLVKLELFQTNLFLTLKYKWKCRMSLEFKIYPVGALKYTFQNPLALNYSTISMVSSSKPNKNKFVRPNFFLPK